MKLKYIVGAIGFLGSVAAQAALVVPEDTGIGELALIVYDANASYTLDLGLTFNQFLANANTSSTLATLGSANFNSFIATEGADPGLQYAVLGGKTNHAGLNSSIISTINADFVGNVIGTYNSANVEGAVAQINPFYNEVNKTGTHKTSANGDSVNPVNTPAYFLTSGMDTFNQSIFSNASAVGTAMAVDYLRRQNSGASDPVEILQPGTINLSQTGGSYVLSYSVAAVPEASGYALALAGFGVLGFLGRRRSDQS